MADDRFSFVHMSDMQIARLGIDDDDFEVDLPDEDIDVPSHLMPRFQDEVDESLLPTNAHPSYPFGNPYTPEGKAGLVKDAFTTYRSLATNLPALLLPRGVPRHTLQWEDLGLNQLLPPHETKVVEVVNHASAADQVAREGEEAQHRAANASNEDSDTESAGSVVSTPPAIIRSDTES